MVARSPRSLTARSLCTRAILTVRDLLASKRSSAVKFVAADAPVVVAAQQLTNNRETALIVKDPSTRRVVGLLTQGDIVRCLASRLTAENMSLQTLPSEAAVGWDDEPADPALGMVSWDVPVSCIMTPTEKIVYLTPGDTIDEARDLLATCGKRHIPVLDGSSFLGVISPMTVLRCLSPAGGRSAKDAFVTTVMPRRGVPQTTQIDQPAEGEEAQQRLAITPAVCNLPHPHKGTAGEDAYLLGPQLVGVADGALMHASAGECAERARSGAEQRPRKARVLGSATICLVALHPSKPELIAANIGDSGFLLLRPAHTASPRLGTLGVAAQGAAPSSPEADGQARYSDAALVRVPIEEGDVVVLATDGLFDNVGEEEVIAVVEASEGEGAQQLATRLAHRAQELSLDREVDSPFAVLAKENDILWGGGRPDDITVVAFRVAQRGAAGSTAVPLASGPGALPESTRLGLESSGRGDAAAREGWDIGFTERAAEANWD
ncbi:Hypothetical protein EMIHUDRAFT_460475 [Emiliania huxleyi CCMP1516]|uniref:Protein phosphatase n=2 Tax=Emiliania huxleyi TaxID=2903 RepID=A0A0D3KQ32_EMIH1|nr:Hypothetical protein EMIHUDRAFT_460475 [Emiliania huxleyi CCMP1516]EOD37867.1 Hypothetical protein EMIHUDRAFT_460475 [Emiliania huxleyi CCMP1516]|eukprot:XP_005790296.1 Hypothetical protein EMIHUDRAFT_460475 [Emiliania huxleyi CCMP1516]